MRTSMSLSWPRQRVNEDEIMFRGSLSRGEIR